MLRNYHKEFTKTCFYRDIENNYKYYVDIDGNVFRIHLNDVEVINPVVIGNQRYVYIESLKKNIS